VDSYLTSHKKASSTVEQDDIMNVISLLNITYLIDCRHTVSHLIACHAWKKNNDY